MRSVILIQFAKSPETDRVKTRLVPPLRPEQAVALHKNLVRHTAQTLAQCDDSEAEIWSSKGGEFVAGLCGELRVGHRQQSGDDLGQRLQRATADALGRTAAVIVVGSDCPYLSASYLAQAISALRGKGAEVVLGPAVDGGYVLIGLRRPAPVLFDEIDWGSDRVLGQTLARARAQSLEVAQLPVLADIDRPADLEDLATRAEYRHLLPEGYLP